jgi:hypothetical protein
VPEGRRAAVHRACWGNPVHLEARPSPLAQSLIRRSRPKHDRRALGHHEGARPETLGSFTAPSTAAPGGPAACLEAIRVQVSAVVGSRQRQEHHCATAAAQGGAAGRLQGDRPPATLAVAALKRGLANSCCAVAGAGAGGTPRAAARQPGAPTWRGSVPTAPGGAPPLFRSGRAPTPSHPLGPRTIRHLVPARPWR